MLKRCPCCGGEAICTQVTVLFELPGDVKARIQCANCGLMMEGSYNEAKEKWNTRPEPASYQKPQITIEERR